jgi:uncharacterized protein YjiS (DUF1127 family)
MGTITANSLATRWAAPSSLCSAGSLMRLPQLWLLRHFRRGDLAALAIEQVRDCGLDPEAVRREAAKPFWRE